MSHTNYSESRYFDQLGVFDAPEGSGYVNTEFQNNYFNGIAASGAYSDTGVPARYMNHTNHLNQSAYNNPTIINSYYWDTTLFDQNNAWHLRSDIEFIQAKVIMDLRKHARAIIENFRDGNASGNLFPSNNPSFSAVDVASDDAITYSEYNQTNGTVNPANAGLLDDLKEGYSPTNIAAITSGTFITREKINEIVDTLVSANNYTNYVNHTNTGVDQVRNDYQNHSNSHVASYRGWFCHRNDSSHTNTGISSLPSHLRTPSPSHTNHANSPHTNYTDNL